MPGNPQRDLPFLGDDGKWRLRSRTEDDRIWAWQILRAKCLRDRISPSEPEHLGDVGHGDWQRLVARPGLRREESVDRLFLERVRTEAVRGVRRVHDQSA